MPIKVTPSDQACGAFVTGVDLTQDLSTDLIQEIRMIWLDHHVIAFPDQAMNDDDLERVTQYFGPFGHDPYIASLEDREHVIALTRLANETSPIFAETWHADWTFQEKPPIGTCLLSLTVLPVGGDTLFANQHKALQEMPDELRHRIDGKVAIHSAQGGYAPDGLYGDNDADDRSMQILSSDTAYDTELHPLIMRHPETGREALYGTLGYIIGLDGMNQEEAFELLMEVHKWQTRPEFIYSHKWRSNMFVMWDNRSLLHKAKGGYDGYDRILHRTTIGSV